MSLSPMYAGNAVFVVSAAIDALVVCALVAWAVRRQPRPPLLLAGVAVALGALLFKLAVMVSVGGLQRSFGVAHVLWLDAVVVVPLGAALLALLGWRGGGWALRTLVVLGLLMVPVGAYGSFVEPGRLVVEHATVPLSQERAGDDAVRVAVLADIQFEHLGDHERESVARLMEQRPDLILLSGDYHQGTVDGFERELPRLRELFATLRAPGGVFAVQGDAESPTEARRIFDDSGIRLLDDELVRTRVGDREITITGIEQQDRSPRARAAARELERLPGDRDIRLLLVHHPDPVLRLQPDSRVDLVVSGHTHGGQIQVPFYGPYRTASAVPRDVGAGGLHSLDGRRVYVSRGIGVERGQAPKIRIGAPPEVSVLELG